MPFGLTNAPASFQRCMNLCFGDMINDFVLIYLDDILVYSNTASEHLAHLRRVLDRLRAEQWFAKRKKCSFGDVEAHYLGHVVGHGRCWVDPSKTDAVRSWPPPTCIKDL